MAVSMAAISIIVKQTYLLHAVGLYVSPDENTPGPGSPHQPLKATPAVLPSTTQGGPGSSPVNHSRQPRQFSRQPLKAASAGLGMSRPLKAIMPGFFHA